MKLLDLLLASLLFVVPLLHLIVAPYSKVEESFPLQATHDVLVYGTPTDNVSVRLGAYDHFTFPGAVPRTFLGPVVLAGISQPLIALVGFHHAQFVVRAVLGAVNAGSLLVFRGAMQRAFGPGPARWWTLLVVSQFHVAYYLSRTLPNMFAFGLTTLASAFLLPKSDPGRALVRRKQAIALLIFAGAVFRSEIAILLATTALQLLLTQRITLKSLIPVSLGSFVVALGLSVPVDSYFWQKPLWPELWGFYYNAVLGSSSEWGVSPWYYYFASAIPRLLLNPLVIPLILFAFSHPGISSQARNMAIPSLLFVAIYSVQPHKETRFIFYAVPALTGAAALGANFISSRYAKSVMYRLGVLALGLSVLATGAASFAMLLISSLNYPGGDALAQLHDLTRHEIDPTLSVHADVLTCMTGLTLFAQNRAGLPLAYGAPPKFQQQSSPVLLIDKTENDDRLGQPQFWEQFQYVLAEDPTTVLGDWDPVGLVLGYDGVEVLTPKHQKSDLETAEVPLPKILGNGAAIVAVKDFVRKYTGGWWVGPRMSPRIYILKQAAKVGELKQAQHVTT